MEPAVPAPPPAAPPGCWARFKVGRSCVCLSPPPFHSLSPPTPLPLKLLVCYISTFSHPYTNSSIECLKFFCLPTSFPISSTVSIYSTFWSFLHQHHFSIECLKFLCLPTSLPISSTVSIHLCAIDFWSFLHQHCFAIKCLKSHYIPTSLPISGIVQPLIYLTRNQIQLHF